MSNANPNTGLTVAQVTSQDRIVRGSLSSTETLQRSESDVSTSSKAPLVHNSSLGTKVINAIKTAKATKVIREIKATRATNKTNATNETNDPETAEVVSPSVEEEIHDDGDVETIPRTTGWIKAAFTMFKTQVGLGVLQLPKAFSILGLIPGIFFLYFLTAVGIWLAFQIGQTPRRHSRVRSLADVGRKVGGRFGEEIFGGAYFLYFLFVGSSAIITISMAFNVVSNHAACTNYWVALATAIAFGLSSIPHIGKVGPFAIAGTVSIISAIVVFCAALGLGFRPGNAALIHAGPSDWKLVGNPTTRDAMSAFSTIVFAFSGIPSFFNIHAEMKEPKHYNRAMLSSMSGVAFVYTSVALTVYILCGSHVTSPALGSAGGRFKLISYAVALLGLCVTACLMLHYANKHVYVRIIKWTSLSHKKSDSEDDASRNLEGAPKQKARERRNRLIWYCCCFAVVLVAYIIANAVPSFQNMVNLIGAFLGTSICFYPMALLWFYDNWKSTPRDGKFWLYACWNAFMISAGTVILVAGTWVACSKIRESRGSSSAWSCADNSNN